VNEVSRSVAIVGSGPGGMYVAQALQEKQPDCRIDIIEKLPTPFGLIRGGVAPDHQHTKRVDQKYAQTIENGSNIRYLGNLTLGKDLSLKDLEEIYDAVVLAYGAPYDNRLGIPGENKANVFGSNEFVGWYNCHPEFRALDPDLDIKNAVVIGVGNVAVDVARVLSRTPEEMASTDIADYAMTAIDNSPLQNIYMVGRRGPLEASFTNTELKELGELSAATTVVDGSLIPESASEKMDDRERKVRERILGTLRDLSTGKAGEKRRTLRIEFFASPVEVRGEDRIESLILEKNRVEDGKCIGTGETFELPCDLLVTCIGSRAEAIDGVPFNERRGIAETTNGRAKARVYAAGWLKRGASGTIGTNRLDSYAVTDLLISEFDGTVRPGPWGMDKLITERSLSPINFSAWKKLKLLEEQAAIGSAPRKKFSTVDDMLRALG
jgi:NADPH-dependent glutamate synthase beta subunit-like oxidoreductase